MVQAIAVALIGAVVTILLGTAARVACLIPAIRSRIGLEVRRGGDSREGRRSRTCKVAVMLGSGGHTTEMLQLLSALPSERYTPLLFLISSGDTLSAAKARDAAESRTGSDTSSSMLQPPFVLIEIPRARRVHQPLYLAPFSTLRALAACVRIVWPVDDVVEDAGRKGDVREQMQPFADLLLMNGPGTCVPLVMALYLLRFIGYPTPRMLYVESFARVRSLSLTGKLLRPVVDRFVVQWPSLASEGAEEVNDDEVNVPSASLGADSPAPWAGRIEYRGWLT